MPPREGEGPPGAVPQLLTPVHPLRPGILSPLCLAALTAIAKDRDRPSQRESSVLPCALTDNDLLGTNSQRDGDASSHQGDHVGPGFRGPRTIASRGRHAWPCIARARGSRDLMFSWILVTHHPAAP